jgi:hypothetical protein
VHKQVTEKVPESRDQQEEEQGAREWADEQAAFVGAIWANRYPGGTGNPATRFGYQRGASTIQTGPRAKVIRWPELVVKVVGWRPLGLDQWA